MEIILTEITIRDLVAGYRNDNEEGVVGYGGKLDIRPPYQREFVYKDEQRKAVINTVMQNFPLNIMYWAVRKDGGFEIIDGQQRTLSICEYVEGNFSLKNKFFYNLQEDEQEKILNYELTVYFCSGENSEKLDWFKTINIAGEELTDQELRNAVYHGSWVSDAKRYFSKTNCAAYGIGHNYLSGSSIRQEYLETAIKWISKNSIEEYMGKNSKKENAKELWAYFQNVIDWVESTFSKYRREMKGIEWGFLFNEYGKGKYDAKKIETQVSALMEDEEVQRKSGIYAYILSGKEKHLNLRSFTPKQKREVFEKQKGVCAKCGETFKIEEMEADHIKPWSKGGKTVLENCQMLCKAGNRKKSNK